MGTGTTHSNLHRAKLWQIGGFAFNNSATNLYMFMMNFIAYYLTGYVEIGLHKAGKCRFSNVSGVCKGLQFAFDTTIDTNFQQNRDF